MVIRVVKLRQLHSAMHDPVSFGMWIVSFSHPISSSSCLCWSWSAVVGGVGLVPHVLPLWSTSYPCHFPLCLTAALHLPAPPAPHTPPPPPHTPPPLGNSKHGVTVVQVLDDTRTLCLPNSERIRLDNSTMRVLFEVGDLAKASPATVSRCGMVYVAPQSLGWRPCVK